MQEEIYKPEEHDSVPVEDAFRDGRKVVVVNCIGSRRIGTGGRIWSARDNDPAPGYAGAECKARNFTNKS